MDRRQTLRAVPALLLAVVIALLPQLAWAKDTVAFTIRDNRLEESSGFARDSAAGLYWTITDSGAKGVAYALTPKGKVAGTLNYRAEPRDVEAVAVRGNQLYLADIGDNDLARSLITVYTFDNPRANGLTVTYHSYDFRYPDGRHDAETLLVDGKGRWLIVSKGLRGAVYSATNPSRDGVNALTKVGSAPGLVTDGTFLPGDKQIALLTATNVVVVDAKSFKTVATANFPKQKQPEALTMSLDGQALLVGSEGKNAPVYAIPVPTASPSATPTTSPSGKATPSATATTPADPGDDPDAGADDGDDGATPADRGTWYAVGLAGAVAVVAGVVVAFVRRPGSRD